MDRQHSTRKERVTRFPAAHSRPTDYPPDLPFVPGMLVEITQSDDGRVMKWWGVSRPIDLLQQLTGALVTAGWTRVHDAEATRVPVRSLRFRCGALERSVEAVQAGPFSFVSLREPCQ